MARERRVGVVLVGPAFSTSSPSVPPFLAAQRHLNDHHTSQSLPSHLSRARPRRLIPLPPLSFPPPSSLSVLFRGRVAMSLKQPATYAFKRAFGPGELSHMQDPHDPVKALLRMVRTTTFVVEFAS